jgi:SWI/SNF-related matrix-associated actin-dependent regulator of chromatin subfamily D
VSSSRKFSQFLKRVSIELDPTEYRTDNFIEWDNRRSIEPTHGFEVTRPGSKDVRCKIVVEVAYPVQLYSVSPALRLILGPAVPAIETLENVIRALWLYMKRHQLEIDRDSGNVLCDERLSALLANQSSFALEDLPRLVRPHLSAPPPLEIDFVIRLNGSPPEERQVFDILVQEPHESVRAHSGATTEIVALDRSISDAVKEIATASKRYRALTALAEDPVGFMQTLVRSNARDLMFLEAHEAMQGPVVNDEFFLTPYVENAARQYLLTQKLKKMEELEAATRGKAKKK